MWIEFELGTGETTLVNAANIAHIRRSDDKHFKVTFADSEVSPLFVVATESKLRGLLSPRS